jgi:hypothetical protein
MLVAKLPWCGLWVLLLLPLQHLGWGGTARTIGCHAHTRSQQGRSPVQRITTRNAEKQAE